MQLKCRQESKAVSHILDHHVIITLTVSKGCPTTREASPPTPPANKLAPGEALSFSKVDLWDEGAGVGGVVLVGEADDDLAVLLLSKGELVFEFVWAKFRLDMFTFELVAIAMFISRMDGWMGSEQGQVPWVVCW